MTRQIPPIDLHAHVNPRVSANELLRLGAVIFAATRSVSEFEQTLYRRDHAAVWGVGCHPRNSSAIQSFDKGQFAELVQETFYVSEVGLDGRSEVPMKQQIRVFETILQQASESTKLLCIHSTNAAEDVLDLLEIYRPEGAILHWWKGSEAQTERALELGCNFSFNEKALLKNPIMQIVPLSRILTETDFPHGVVGPATKSHPGAVLDVEAQLSRVYGISKIKMRKVIWLNAARTLQKTSCTQTMPQIIRNILSYVGASSEAIQALLV